MMKPIKLYVLMYNFRAVILWFNVENYKEISVKLFRFSVFYITLHVCNITE